MLGDGRWAAIVDLYSPGNGRVLRLDDERHRLLKPSDRVRIQRRIGHG